MRPTAQDGYPAAFDPDWEPETDDGPCEGQAPVANDCVPVAIGDEPTVRVVTPTLEQVADRMAERMERRLGWRR